MNQPPYPPNQPPYGNQPPYPSYPPPQPGNFGMPPQQPRRGPWAWYRQQSRAAQIVLGVVILGFALCFCSSATVGLIQGATGAGATPTAAVVNQATQNSQPTDTPTTAQDTPTPETSHWPPKTKVDLDALAAVGDANQVQGFHSESVGLTGVCPQPKTLATVDASLKGQQLAQDLLAYFFGNQMDNPCGSVLFAFHSQSEGSGDNGYTAGRVLLDTTDSSGGMINDPNATGVTYRLTLDTGDALNSQEYVITWTK